MKKVIHLTVVLATMVLVAGCSNGERPTDPSDPPTSGTASSESVTDSDSGSSSSSSTSQSSTSSTTVEQSIDTGTSSSNGHGGGIVSSTTTTTSESTSTTETTSESTDTSSTTDTTDTSSTTDTSDSEEPNEVDFPHAVPLSLFRKYEGFNRWKFLDWESNPEFIRIDFSDFDYGHAYFSIQSTKAELHITHSVFYHQVPTKTIYVRSAENDEMLTVKINTELVIGPLLSSTDGRSMNGNLYAFINTHGKVSLAVPNYAENAIEGEENVMLEYTGIEIPQ